MSTVLSDERRERTEVRTPASTDTFVKLVSDPPQDLLLSSKQAYKSHALQLCPAAASSVVTCV